MQSAGYPHLVATSDALRRAHQRALSRVLPARDDPEERYHLRRSFYRHYGFGGERPAGYGNAELAFLRWAIERGVLNPLDHPARTGSPWWRAVNERVLLDAEIAAAAHEARVPAVALPWAAQLWMGYIATPSPASWFRAHNASVMQGYIEHVSEALAETEAEQRLLDRVLHRLLFAHALVTPGALSGVAGAARIVDPQGPLVATVLCSEALYPRTYPVGDALPRAGDWVAELVDERLIAPRRRAIHAIVATAVGTPELSALTRCGEIAYPQGALAPQVRTAEPTRYDGWRSREREMTRDPASGAEPAQGGV